MTLSAVEVRGEGPRIGKLYYCGFGHSHLLSEVHQERGVPGETKMWIQVLPSIGKRLDIAFELGFSNRSHRDSSGS